MFFVFSVYTFISVLSAVYLLASASYRNALLSVAYPILVFTIWGIAEAILKINFSAAFLAVALILPIGALLGTAYEFYIIIPFFDSFLHTLSGFIFAALGYSLMKRILMRDGNSSRVACLMFAFAFSLAVALLWEMAEWGLTVLLNGDMQEDSIVNEIRSYFLSGSHNKALELIGITKTEIHHSGGVYVINGYLDLGLTDTLIDMLVCLIGSMIYTVMGAIEIISGKNIIQRFTPTVIYSETSSGEISL